MKRWLVLFGVVASIAVIGGAGYLGSRQSPASAKPAVVAPPTVPVDRGDVAQTITAPGQLVSAHEMMISAAVSAPVSKIFVHPGQHVKAGEIMARLNDSTFQAAVRTAQAALTSAQSAYAVAVDKNDHNKDQIIVAKTALDKATVAVSSAQAAYDKVAWRGDIGMLPQSADLQKATIDYQSALANYNLTLTNINDSALKAADQAVVQAQEALKQAQENLDNTKFAAPFDGIVLEVLAKEGDVVAAGADLIRVYDPQAIEARTTVTEEDYPLARVGQVAQVYLDSQPDLVVTGHVTYIVPLREASSASPVYPVYIALDNPPESLAPGMTVDGSILIAKRSNVLRLPRALVHARSDGTAPIQVWANGKAETRLVKTGLRGDQHIEILSGVNEGEQVVSR